MSKFNLAADNSRPQSIIWFERLFFASLAVTAIDLFVHRDILYGDPSERLEFGLEILGAILIVGVFVFGIQLLLWYFIAHRASRIARSIYALFFVFGIVGIIALFDEYTVSELAFSAVTQSLVFASVVFLFRPDSGLWFKTGGRRSDDEGDDLSDVFR